MLQELASKMESGLGQEKERRKRTRRIAIPQLCRVSIFYRQFLKTACCKMNVYVMPVTSCGSFGELHRHAWVCTSGYFWNLIVCWFLCHQFFFPLSSVCLAELLCYSLSILSIERIPLSFHGCLHLKTRTSTNLMSYGMTIGNPNSKSAECFLNE